jgi:hypothetical protein
MTRVLTAKELLAQNMAQLDKLNQKEREARAKRNIILWNEEQRKINEAK